MFENTNDQMPGVIEKRINLFKIKEISDQKISDQTFGSNLMPDA
jgi:hypothetical protein